MQTPRSERLRIAVVGGGNGGQAIAGHLAMAGHAVTLCSRNRDKVEALRRLGGIRLTDQIEGFGVLESVTCSLEEAIPGRDVVMIATTADGHRELAVRMAPIMRPGQVVLLNPGRTGGAIEFRHVLQERQTGLGVIVGETQSLVFACRAEATGVVRVLGVKERVLVAALPRRDTRALMNAVQPLYPCFLPAPSVLVTSLENIGAILHCPIALLNAAAIERGDRFRFYSNITPQVARFIVRLDEERMRLGEVFQVSLHSAEEWVSYAYESAGGGDLFARIKHNRAYYEIESPTHLRSRMLMEDIPTGILPMIELGASAGLDLKLMRAVYDMAEALLEEDFRSRGRTRASLGLDGLSVNQIKAVIEHE